MIIISKSRKNCLKKFAEWGGLFGVICYIIQGDIINALVALLVFGIIVILLEKHIS